jgi:hypothetical protein
MTREKRLIVSVVAIGLVGIAALGVLARQLGSRVPSKSVHDLPPAESPAPMPDLPAAAVATAAAPKPAAPLTPARLVDGFLAGRKAVAALVARSPLKFKKIDAELSGDYASMKGVRTGIEVDAMATYKVERYEALAAVGLSEADYASVRASWRTWKSGGTVEPALHDEFEKRRDALAAAELGPYERLDEELK